MTIRGILRNGVIEPTEPIPADWEEGRELAIEDSQETHDPSRLAAWAAEIEAHAAQIPPEEHARFSEALLEIERESKAAVRREWGLE